MNDRKNKKTVMACIQMNSTEDKGRNLATARALLEEAAAEADVLALPEYFNFLGPDEDTFRQAEDESGPSVSMLREVAVSRRKYIVGGSIAERYSDEKCRNTMFVIGPDGSILARYSKMHLFDISLRQGHAYTESARVSPGNDISVVDTPLGAWGFTICYDLRFPELFRALAFGGADVIFAPAAFTLMTGKDHWEVLLRARAIENQVYVVASAQVGAHQGKMCYGRAMIIDPWGTVTAQMSDAEGYVCSAVDLDYRKNVQRQIPCMANARRDLFSFGITERSE